VPDLPELRSGVMPVLMTLRGDDTLWQRGLPVVQRVPDARGGLVRR